MEVHICEEILLISEKHNLNKENVFAVLKFCITHNRKKIPVSFLGLEILPRISRFRKDGLRSKVKAEVVKDMQKILDEIFESMQAKI